MNVKWIVIHTAAAANENGIFYPTIDDVDRWHRERGWSMIGYHFFIEKDGTEKVGRPVNKAGAHTRGLNDEAIGICVSGHGDLVDFNAEQMTTLIKVVKRELNNFSLTIDNVIGHREVHEIAGAPPPNKSCPGTKVSMDGIRQRLAVGQVKDFCNDFNKKGKE